MEFVDESCTTSDVDPLHFCEKRKASAAFAIIALLMTALAAGFIASGLQFKKVHIIMIGARISFFAGTQNSRPRHLERVNEFVLPYVLHVLPLRSTVYITESSSCYVK